jgi:hypothetical protein
MTIESVDLANCYDAVAHPIASIALQSFKVCKVMVAMMLYVLKIMTWYLKTAFGQSKISFGGIALDPSMGLGQGDGAPPPGLPGSLHIDDKCIPQSWPRSHIYWDMGTRCLYPGGGSLR